MDFLGASITNEGRLVGDFAIDADQREYFLLAGRSAPAFDKAVPLPSDFHDPVRNRWYLSPHDMQRVAALYVHAASSLRTIRRVLEGSKRSIKVALVMTMFNERHRLDPDYGDALRIKIRQLEEVRSLTGGRLDWELVFVPIKGDPDDCGRYLGKLVGRPDIVASVIERRIRIHREIGNEDRDLLGSSLHLTASKGLGVLIAFRTLLSGVEDQAPDILAYTDIDTSTDLRFLGVLVQPMLGTTGAPRRFAALGSRIVGIAVPDVPSTAEGRIGKTIVAMRRKFLLPSLRIVDTQAGFKAYSRGLMAEIIERAKDPTAAFDTELQLLAQRAGAEVRELPIFWSDTEESRSSMSPNRRLEMLEGWIDQSERMDPVLAVETLAELRRLTGSIKDVVEEAEKVRLTEILRRWLEGSLGDDAVQKEII